MKAIIADNQSQVMQYGIQLLVLAVIGLVAGVINTIFAAKVSQSIAADVRANEYKKIQSFSFGNIEKFSAGNLVVRMTNDVNQVQQLVMMFLQSLTRIPILFVGAFILALMTFTTFVVDCGVMVILIALSSQIVFKQMGKFFTRIQKLIDKTNTLAKENLQGVRVVKSFNQSKMKQRIFFAIMIGGMMSTFASRGFVSLARIKEVLDTEPDLTYDANAEDLDLSGDVSFKNVAFTYPGDQKPALENISFDVKSGEMIGIVGATGSGKTTLAQLIARLYDPSAGEVTVGGVNLKHVNEKSLRRAVSYVLQRAILFSGTIAGNLRQGNQGASETELQKAAEIAQAAEFVNRYDDNFEHEVEERSANFSGGQNNDSQLRVAWSEILKF
ncbi:hypothetical protein Pfo_031606 [Paulownia fortunei]|nr:hypothetical protein Pfo_031606 [Paulownia fortunei]